MSSMLIETDRLLVRRLMENDTDALFAVLSDTEVMRYIEPTFSREQTQVYAGRTMDVLADDVNTRDPSLLTGRLSNNSVVHFPGSKELIGTIVPVRLDEAKGFYYYGTISHDVSIS